MKQSIRTRFTLIFVGLSALSLVAIWCVNNLCLESFYMMDKLRVLERVYERFDQLVLDKAGDGKTLIEDFEESENSNKETLGDVAFLLRMVAEQYNISIVVSDSVTGETILPSARDGAFLADKAQRYILGYDLPKTEVLRRAENFTIQKTYDSRSKAFYLESWGYFSDNRTTFIMSTPLASIRESVAVSNRFLAYVGSLAMILSCIVVYLTTRKVTSPILKLASLSEKMSNLDFEAKYEGNAQDEIGVLGTSMNRLSDKLKDTIGELKSANLELQKDIEEKIQIDEMRKEFIANVSHELKTPIALIQGYAEGLTEGMCEDKESRDYYCEVIMDEANKMNKMVRQLLTLTALEFGNDTAVMERFDLTELIRGVLSSAGILIQNKQAAVEFHADEPVYVWADEFKIEEVVTNYLNNALNHLDGEKKIIIRMEENSGEVRVSVRNTGQPIPEADLPNIWTKFYKVDKARTREYGGSGIGLSIVKAIMDSHHKECGVRNMEGGVEFWFTLDTSNDMC